TSVIENGRLAPPEKLRRAFAAGRVDLEAPVITSCGSGVTAAILWLALDALGSPPNALSDGSWSEWASPADPPIEPKAGSMTRSKAPVASPQLRVAGRCDQ